MNARRLGGGRWRHAKTHRLVVDLWNYPIRGREQAEHLIETILRPRWEAANEA